MAHTFVARGVNGLVVLSAVIITGSPPFGLFFSEMIILRAGFAGAHVTVTAVFLAALVALFCGVAAQIGRLVTGPPPEPTETPPDPERFDIGLATTSVAAVVAVVSAFYLPAPLLALIRAATLVVWGGP